MTPVAVTRSAVRPCPQCGGSTLYAIHEGHYLLPDGHPLDPAVNVVACSRCGFCFNDTASRREDYDRYYRESSKYADARLSTGAGASAEASSRLADTAKCIFEMAGPTEAAVLDIGYGAGGLLDALIDSNPVLQGKQLAGRPIRGPEEIVGNLPADVPILIGSLVNLAPIEAAIRGRGIPNPIVTLTQGHGG